MKKTFVKRPDATRYSEIQAELVNKHEKERADTYAYHAYAIDMTCIPDPITAIVVAQKSGYFNVKKDTETVLPHENHSKYNEHTHRGPMGKLIDAAVNYDFWRGLNEYRKAHYNRGIVPSSNLTP